jgi:hypothetical protein
MNVGSMASMPSNNARQPRPAIAGSKRVLPVQVMAPSPISGSIVQ